MFTVELTKIVFSYPIDTQGSDSSLPSKVQITLHEPQEVVEEGEVVLPTPPRAHESQYSPPPTQVPQPSVAHQGLMQNTQHDHPHSAAAPQQVTGQNWTWHPHFLAQQKKA